MDVIVTADGYRTFHGLQELNEDKLQEFLEVVNRAYVKKPNQKDLDELRKWIN